MTWATQDHQIVGIVRFVFKLQRVVMLGVSAIVVFEVVEMR